MKDEGVGGKRSPRGSRSGQKTKPPGRTRRPRPEALLKSQFVNFRVTPDVYQRALLRVKDYRPFGVETVNDFARIALIWGIDNMPPPKLPGRGE